MIYRAKKACTDVGGRYFDKDEEANLDPLLPHSELLIPADPTAVLKLMAAAAKAAKIQAAKDAIGAEKTPDAEREILNIEKETQDSSAPEVGSVPAI